MEHKAIATLQNGRYELTTQIGRGFFSQTYQGTDTKSGRGIVAKTLALSLRKHKEFSRFKQHFLQQAQRLSRCHHPHLAAVLDYFEENSLPYIIYQRIEGQCLGSILESGFQLAQAKALQYIDQVSQALNVLHAVRIQHLDLKPQNLIYCQKTDRVFLTDPCLTGELTPGIQQTHASLLSPGYAAPEQYKLDHQCTVATDIYGLAATFYCFLSGHSPPPAPLREHIPFQDWQNLPSALSPSLEQAILQGMRINRDQRPQTIDGWLSLLSSQDSISPSIPEPVSHETLEAMSLDSSSSAHPEASPPLETSRFPLGALLITSAIAASAGIGFGLAIRFNSPQGAGSTLFHPEQSFPTQEEMNADSL